MGRKIAKLVNYIKSDGILSVIKMLFRRIVKWNVGIFLCIKEFGYAYFFLRTYFFQTEQFEKYNKLNYDILVEEAEPRIREALELAEKSQKDVMKKTVWVCWWQGYDKMPEIVRMCYDHLVHTLDKDLFEIKLITADNFKEYVNIPGVVMGKYKEGKITLTLFSDILREGLLFQNGGVWIDLTIWVEKDVNKYLSLDKDFWSVKLEEIEDQKMWGQLISECKWCGFLISARKHNTICGFVFHAMCDYVTKHDYVIDYFLHNLLIRIAYDKIPKAKEEIDKIEYSNPNLYKLLHYLNSAYSEDLYDSIVEDTAIFKLTYKTSLYEYSPVGDITVYGHLRQRAADGTKQNPK